MAKDVRCSVTTCAYHDSNNKCLGQELKFQNVIVVHHVMSKKQSAGHF